MNVNNIPDQPSAKPLANAQQPKGAVRMRVASGTAPQNDRADTSSLSRMMARSSAALKNELAARPDVIDSFKSRLDEPVNLSDSDVKTMLYRMGGM